ncbi:MAG: class I SAM-dependent methyltransferase [Nitratireductor sp.]|nr:class I SAM-dependent methyltransferase [Nitratireductor sp.]
MSENGHDGHLGAVYDAKGADEVAALYDRWAGTYDEEMAKAGYRHPSICLALLARHLPKGAGPLLDAGAGTGLIGEWLGIIGYREVEALDISQGMLDVAARKGAYQAYHRLALGGALPFGDGHFAGIVSAGVFTTGHVGAEGLDELVRITRPGGVIVLTVKTTLWDGGVAAKVEELKAAQRVRTAELTEPYVSMPGETGTIPSLAVALVRV